MIEMYLVGGAVRDRLLGLEPHDLDFTVVASSFDDMLLELEALGVETFLAKEEFGVVRGRFPRKAKPGFPWTETWNAGHSWRTENGQTLDENGNPPKEQPFTPFFFHDIDLSGAAVDFVLARKEGPYSDGRHPDWTEVGTLYDDLARRDLTMNAVAMNDQGVYIDPFGGQKDIENQKLVAVGDPVDRLREDALRAIRVLRFSITKGIQDIDPALVSAMRSSQVYESLRKNIAIERVQAELQKAFQHNTVAALILLNEFPSISSAVFGPTTRLWLLPTLSGS